MTTIVPHQIVGYEMEARFASHMPKNLTEGTTDIDGDHALASSTTPRIIMSDSSDNMEFSPIKFDQVSACEKLRDTVTGISTLHKSIYGMDERSPSPRNTFKDLYLSSTQAMIRRKEEMVSELKTLPPCTRADCQDHKIPSTSVEEETNFEPSPPENENNIKTASKPKKKLCKNVSRNVRIHSEEFIFPKKTARPISPTSTQDPIETNNSFSDLEQDAEHPPQTVKVTTEVVTPKITPPTL
ncbi:hypothetical protein TNCV_4693131 [Trichonephila clavipes]|nr:hypothetical protein TNCV_4693131 [Trichonephila clavipes]